MTQVSSPGRLTNVDGLKREIAEGVTLSTVAEHLGLELQAAGEQWRASCPFHEERTPSFHVTDVKGPMGFYHCFGCKAEGDMIDLVEKLRHLGFVETMYWLAAEADVDISAYERPLSESEKREEEFRQRMEGWLEGSGNYVPSRVDLDVANMFGVVVRHPAVAPPAPYFNDKPYLLNGVILPWRSPSGRLVGWRVREHEGAEKSVRGTPNDFPIGKLSDTLFGIQEAREHVAEGRIVLVEGEYDTLALHAHHQQNTVGMGGSTLTDGQCAMLEKLHIREAVALFDGDVGGHKAAQAFAEKYWAHDKIFFRVAVCNDGTDPEDVVNEEDGEFHLGLALVGARSALEFLLRQEWLSKSRTSLTEKLEFVKWIRDTYGAKLRSTDESLVLAEVAKWLEIPELEIRDYVRAMDGSLCAVDSERLLIGRACRDAKFYVHLRGQLARDDFFVLKHQRIWDLLSDMLVDGQDFDLPTLEARAKVQGVAEGYIEECTKLPDANWEYHKGVVADMALRRSARDDVATFKDRIVDLGQPADLLVGDLTHRITAKALRTAGATQKQLSEQVDQAMDTLHERMNNPNEIHGLDLGSQFPQLSRMLQGLQPRRLVLIAAGSRVGKSTIMSQWVTAIGVHQSVPVDVVSLEMDETELLYKMTSHMTGIDSMKISGGRLEPDEAKTVEHAMLRIRNSPLHIWAPDGLTASEFMLYARESIMQRRTQAFFIDYIQLIDAEPHQAKLSKYDLFGEFGRICKMKVARGMETCVVCCAQLRREVADKDRPVAEDLADSYAIVRHSDVIVILSGQNDSPTMELYLDKNRQGQGRYLQMLHYDRPVQTFYEPSGLHQPEYLCRI